MPLGKESIKRAVETKKTAEKVTEKKVTTLAEVKISDIKGLNLSVVEENKKLTASIKAMGLIKPITLISVDGELYFATGKKKLKSLLSLGKETVTAVVISCSKTEKTIILNEIKKFKASKTINQQKGENVHEYKFKAAAAMFCNIPDYLL